MIGKSAMIMVVSMFVMAALVPMSMIQADGHCTFAEETISIGGIVPLSAPGATVGGIAMDWGFGQAAADINANCGIKINGVNYRLDVITGDSEGISERGQAVAERLILQENVVGIIGVYHSAVGLATMGIMQEQGIPTLYSHPRNDSISASGIIEYDGAPARIDDGIDYIFRISPPSSIVGRVVTNWLISLGVEKVILIVENTDYGHPAAAAETAQLEAAGVQVESLFIELGTEDFAPILSRIQASPEPPDAIRIVISGETSYNVTQQMAELGIAPTPDTICVTNHIAFQSGQFWTNVPDGNYCAFERIGTVPSMFNDLANELNVRYQADFGDILATFAMEAYDSVWIMADAIERAGTFTDSAAIVVALEATDIELAQGRYYFTYGSHNPELPEGTPSYMWHQWPIPVVTIIQYFEPNQSSLDAAVVYPEVYQTHGTSYIRPGTSPD